MTAATQRILGTVQATLALDGVPQPGIRLTARDLAETGAAGLIIRLENRLAGLEAVKTRMPGEIEDLRPEITRARKDSGKAFPQAGQLAAARERARDLDRHLEEAARPPSSGWNNAAGCAVPQIRPTAATPWRS